MKMKKIKGYTIPEMIIALALLSLISIGMFNAMGQLGKSITKTKNQVTSRKKLTPFCHTIHAFANRSLAIYFWDSANSIEFDYVNNFTSLTPGDSLLDTVHFVKNTTGNPIAELIYNPSAHTISWRRSSGVAPQVILENVYRIDYTDNANQGTAPVFRFPHIVSLYDTSTRPRFLTLEFKLRVMAPTSENPNPLMIPVKFMTQVNTLQ